MVGILDVRSRGLGLHLSSLSAPLLCLVDSVSSPWDEILLFIFKNKEMESFVLQVCTHVLFCFVFAKRIIVENLFTLHASILHTHVNQPTAVEKHPCKILSKSQAPLGWVV